MLTTRMRQLKTHQHNNDAPLEDTPAQTPKEPQRHATSCLCLHMCLQDQRVLAVRICGYFIHLKLAEPGLNALQNPSKAETRMMKLRIFHSPTAQGSAVECSGSGIVYAYIRIRNLSQILTAITLGLANTYKGKDNLWHSAVYYFN